MKPLQSDDERRGLGKEIETFDPVGNGNLPPMPYRDMPEPLPLGRVLGPSVILAGLGVGSGEYIIWPFMTATVGTFFLWAAVLSVTVQYFLNMEIERYTLATGETAVAGFVRFWKPWGALFCLFTILPNMWPGWATSGVTILGFLVGPIDVPLVTIGVLVASGVALTASPIVYQTLERAQFFKVGLTLVFLVIAIVAAISPSAWAELPKAVTGFGRLPDSGAIPIALMLSGLVFAGAGGVNNLCQSNWIRDKGFGMGIYIPRIVSPITGEEVAAPATGSMMRQDPRTSAGSGAGGLSPTASNWSRSGSSASSRSRCSRRSPTRLSSARPSRDRRTWPSFEPRARRSSRWSRRGSGRSSGYSARCR